MKKQSGSGLIFAVVLLFVILGMVVTLSSVTVLETKMNQKTKSSVGAFYNADSGVEWALNNISNATGSYISNAFPGFSGNKYPCPSGFNCDMYFLDETGNVITSNLTIDKVKAVRSVGSQGGETQRAIEAAVAATGGGCYVDYSLSAGSAVGSACKVSGFTVKGFAGIWGACVTSGDATTYFVYRPAGGQCTGRWRNDTTSSESSEAFVCCQN